MVIVEKGKGISKVDKSSFESLWKLSLTNDQKSASAGMGHANDAHAIACEISVDQQGKR